MHDASIQLSVNFRVIPTPFDPSINFCTATTATKMMFTHTMSTTRALLISSKQPTLKYTVVLSKHSRICVGRSLSRRVWPP